MKNNVIQVDGKFYIKSQVVMLPTEKASNIWITKISKSLKYNSKVWKGSEDVVTQHLYFLSDEEIKEEDWYIDTYYTEDINIKQCLKTENNWIFPTESTNREDGESRRDCCKKIIATKDESLLITTKSKYIQFGDKVEETKLHSLPRPSNEFLKKYCELGGIEEVLIEVEIFKDDYEGWTPDGIKTIEFEYHKLKVSPDNTITIKPVKDSWNREEVEKLIDKAIQWGRNSSNYQEDSNNWIKQNL